MDGSIKRILVTTDFSKNAEYALKRAIEIAKQHKAQLFVLHVLQKKSMDVFLDNTFSKYLAKDFWLSTEEYTASKLKDKLTALVRSTIQINTKILSNGQPAENILRYAKKNHVDLIVMGAHGKYSIRDSFIGTTTERVVKHTHCAILIVKKTPTKPYRKILLPVTFSKISRNTLRFTNKFQPKSQIELLHVGDHDYEDLLERAEIHQTLSTSKLSNLRRAVLQFLETEMKKFIKALSKKYKYKILLGYPGPTIINEIKKSKPDLTVMSSHEHTRLHYLFIGSVTNWVLTECMSDLLIIPH